MIKSLRWPWAGVIGGTLLFLAPLPGTLAGFLTMFTAIGNPTHNYSEEEISQQVGSGMWILGVTWLLCPVGLILLIWSIVVLVKRRRRSGS